MPFKVYSSHHRCCGWKPVNREEWQLNFEPSMMRSSMAMAEAAIKCSWKLRGDSPLSCTQRGLKPARFVIIFDIEMLPASFDKQANYQPKPTSKAKLIQTKLIKTNRRDQIWTHICRTINVSWLYHTFCWIWHWIGLLYGIGSSKSTYLTSFEKNSWAYISWHL